ncbi:MAG: hypothetical protein MAGBODY4_00772 [Candidatus Marinimicrobia bacterium]|nr:hypothetical protein [Candidatus Neomarinimicrobiota bacterium]
MGGINNDDIHRIGNQQIGPLHRIVGYANCRTDAQSAMLILGGIRKLGTFLYIFDGNQAFERVIIVDHEQLFNFMLLQDGFRLVERSTHRDGNEVFLGHHVFDGLILIGFKPEIAVRQDTFQLVLIINDGDTRDFILRHELQCIGNLSVRRQRHRIEDHPAFGAFDLIHLLRLLDHAHVFVQDADAALSGNGYRHLAFGYSIHRRTN